MGCRCLDPKTFLARMSDSPHADLGNALHERGALRRKPKSNLRLIGSDGYFLGVIDSHFESNPDRCLAGSGPAYVTKMQDSMPDAVFGCRRNVDQANFLITLSRTCKPRDCNRKVCMAPI